ncbi:MAG: tRNA lysidine(34) synthetase TilS [Armatimonadota bacterium]|nr:tRNA lysidine(34) synthetase TilS [bacterium]
MDILSSAKRHHMFDAGDVVIVAVSGGPDSVALLHALHTRSHELGIELHVAHLNHGIRGEASDMDECFVKEFAYNLGLACTISRIDVPTLQAESHTCLEDTARVVRYKFLRDTATKVGASKIAVGHNADDRAESVLLNLIRGAGIDGLGSIRLVRGEIVRPLLDTSRKEIEAYIAENKLPFRVDETNMDIAYSRNRIRYELLPMLESSYNPEIRSALTRLADIASDASDFMSLAAAKARLGVTYRGSMDAGLLKSLPIAIQRQIVRSEIERAKGDLKDISLEQVDRILDALQGDEDFTITLTTGRIYARRSENEFRIDVKREDVVIEPFDIALNVPGITSIAEVDRMIEAEVVTKPEVRKLLPDEVLIDVRSISGQLHARNLQNGDRIAPFGMNASKKLQDVFVDKKIPKGDRARAIVIADDEKILWVAEIVSSEAGKIGADTLQAVRLIVH